MKALKKIIAVTTACIFLSLAGNSQTRPSGIVTEYQGIKTINDSTIRVSPNAKVPAGQVYNIYDSKGNLIATYDSGKSITHLKKTTDCFQYKCPKAITSMPGGKNIRCWRCNQ